MTNTKDIKKKIHNIVASIMLAQPMRDLRYQYAPLARQLKIPYDRMSESVHRAEKTARRAMEAELLYHDRATGGRIYCLARSLFQRYIEENIPDEGLQMRLNRCVHRNCGSTVEVEYFGRLYRADGAPVVEYSDHVPEDEVPRNWRGDDLDAFSLDELHAIAEAIDKGHYVVEEAY